mgnify:CR=1 FL=1
MEEINETGVAKEMDIICKALREDAGYFMSWQANIAVAIQDEFARVGLRGELIHKATNQGAMNVLNLLTRETHNG